MDSCEQARAFLTGEQQLAFREADELWQTLRDQGRVSLAREVLRRIRSGKGLSDGLPVDRRAIDELCLHEALMTGKDPNLSAATRQERALGVLTERYDLDDPRLDDDEPLSLAGHIHQRRWEFYGDLGDLRRAVDLFRRGLGEHLAHDAHPVTNLAYLSDLLGHLGDDPGRRRALARELRQKILNELPVRPKDWLNVSARVEAYLGLGLYEQATEAIEAATLPELSNLQPLTRHLARLIELQETAGPRPLDNPEIARFFGVLLRGSADAARSAFIGRVGLALSGGGFRAAFYHLGVLARLAELDVLRHIEVLSGVSGGSIVGAAYWLALRARMSSPRYAGQVDYIALVRELIEHFERAVAVDLRRQVQASKAGMAWRMLRGQRGMLDPEAAAEALERHFFRPLQDVDQRLYMHELLFTPPDHDPELAGARAFSPWSDNWLRAHKVPIPVFNATALNTGHAWQFGPHKMGELDSPWYDTSASVMRVAPEEYDPESGWQMPLAMAVAASACVPWVFAPVRIDCPGKETLDICLVDGGLNDNQGTSALLVLDCDVILCSDAAGHVGLEQGFESGLSGFLKYAVRPVDTLMERVQQGVGADLKARHRAGLLKGLMYLNIKAGLDAGVHRPLTGTSTLGWQPTLSPSGVRWDYLLALAQLRTDLDAFSEIESRALMACGYQMAGHAFERNLSSITELWQRPSAGEWPFSEMLREITAADATEPRRHELLETLRRGRELRL